MTDIVRKSTPHKIRHSAGDHTFVIINSLCMILFCVIILFPVLNVISVSFSSDQYVYNGSVTFYPKGFRTAAYDKVLTSAALWRSFGNSVFVALGGTFFTLIFTSLAAYPLAFGQFYGKKLYTFMIMLTMWFGGGMIPTFLVVSKLGLVNSLWSLIVLSLLGAYNIVVLRSAFHAARASRELSDRGAMRSLAPLPMTRTKPSSGSTALSSRPSASEMRSPEP